MSGDEQWKGRVLLTGGTGFIASHVLDALVADGFEVIATVRSHEKGRSLSASVAGGVRYVVVPDVAEVAAFDAAIQASLPLDYVVHTASPYHLNVRDPMADFLDPAIQGTTGLLKSIKAHAPGVRRVVVTSSSAAILHQDNHPPVYDESVWAPMTWEAAMRPENAYKASKVFAERAAWDFVRREQPLFELATINCTYTFGPLQRQLRRFGSLGSVNASNQRIRDLVLGRMKGGLPPTAPVFTWVDVRDVALAHVRAMTVPEAGGRRFYIVGGYFSNKRLADIIRNARPALVAGLPPVDSADDLPADVYQFDNRRSREVLGIQYMSLERSVLDTVDSVLAVAAAEPSTDDGGTGQQHGNHQPIPTRLISLHSGYAQL